MTHRVLTHPREPTWRSQPVVCRRSGRLSSVLACRLILSPLPPMRFPLFAAALCSGLLATGASCQSAPTSSAPDGRFLRSGTDSLAIYLVRGADTTRTGTAVDELQVVERDGRTLLQRVYHSVDKVLGARIDTLVDLRETLAPVQHRSRTGHLLEFLEFGDGRATGWMRLANGDSVTIDAPLPAGSYNASTFDLVLRASPLSEGWEAVIPVFLPNTRSVSELRARVAGSEIVDGSDTWRVDAEFTGMPVTFWVDKETRALRQQTMRIRPDVVILFTAPRNGDESRRAD